MVYSKNLTGDPRQWPCMEFTQTILGSFLHIWRSAGRSIWMRRWRSSRRRLRRGSGGGDKWNFGLRRGGKVLWWQDWRFIVERGICVDGSLPMLFFVNNLVWLAQAPRKRLITPQRAIPKYIDWKQSYPERSSYTYLALPIGICMALLYFQEGLCVFLSKLLQNLDVFWHVLYLSLVSSF